MLAPELLPLPEALPVALLPVLEPAFGPPVLPIVLCAVVLVTPTGFDPFGMPPCSEEEPPCPLALSIVLWAVVLVTPGGFDPLGLAADAGPPASARPQAVASTSVVVRDVMDLSSRS